MHFCPKLRRMSAEFSIVYVMWRRAMTTELQRWETALKAVESLSPTDQLKLIRELLLRLQGSVAPSEERVDLLSLSGVGAELWEQVDVQHYINEERDSWHA